MVRRHVFDVDFYHINLPLLFSDTMLLQYGKEKPSAQLLRNYLFSYEFHNAISALYCHTFLFAHEDEVCVYLGYTN